MPERFLNRPENLRCATHRVRVLDFDTGVHRLGVRAPLVLVNLVLVVGMRAQEIGNPRGCGRLPVETARAMHLFAQHFGRCEQRLKQTGCKQFHPAQQRRRFVGGERGQTGHHGSPVDKRETFLALQGDRAKAVFGQCFHCRQPLPIATDVPQTNEQPRHVRQRHQIAARAHRAFRRNLRQDAAVQRRDQQLHHFHPDSRVAARQRVGPRRHNGPRLPIRKQRPLADAEVGQQVELMLFQIFLRDPAGAQRAEAGIDAVDGTRLGCEFLHQGAALAHPLAGRCGQSTVLRAVRQFPEIANCQRMSVEGYHGFTSSVRGVRASLASRTLARCPTPSSGW